MPTFDVDEKTYGRFSTVDVLQTLLGPLVGRGSCREVRRVSFAPDLVIKIETSQQSFQNIIEWETWNWAKDTKWAKWFAPCVEIAGGGCVLIQKRTEPLPDDCSILRLPDFFSDLKLNNFGRLNGRVVAHDYGLTLLTQQGLKAGRMQRADLSAPTGEWE